MSSDNQVSQLQSPVQYDTDVFRELGSGQWTGGGGHGWGKGMKGWCQVAGA